MASSGPLPTSVPTLHGDPSLKARVGPSADVSSSETATTKDISVKVGSKWISSNIPAKKWAWSPFVSSSRADGTAFRHWVRANLEYHDYPYAKFDIHLDPVTYTSEEYDRYLKSNSWTKTETEKLMDLARRFDLRWPIIHDRWCSYVRSKNAEVPNGGASVASRNVEDLQHRYYGVAAIISQARISQEAMAQVQDLSKVSAAASAAITPPSSASNAMIESTTRAVMETAAAKALASTHPNYQPLIASTGTGSNNKFFDVSYERERRARIHAMWGRKKKEELEEVELRKELASIETQLIKLKKSGAHAQIAAAASATKLPVEEKAASASTKAGDDTKTKSTKSPANVISSNAPTPTPGVPYLQSGRLVPPAVGGSTGISKTMAYRMDSFLVELNAPLRPLPTKRTCDLFDSIRKDTIALLSLRKTLLQKESSLQSKRLKLSKMIGDTQVVDEEALLGVPPPAPPVPHASAPTPKPKGKPIKPVAASKGDAAVKKPKAATKRKRKPEGKAAPSTVPSAEVPQPTAAEAIPKTPAAKKRVRKS